MFSTYRFMDSSLLDLSPDREYDIVLRQQPQRAKLSVPNERDKRLIEPPPIIQLHWLNCKEEDKKHCLQSPFYFMIVNIIHAEKSNVLKPLPTKEYLSGTTVSSLYKLRDVDNIDGGFFVFGDLAVKKLGNFKLHFSLFEIIDGVVRNQKNLLSNAFRVYPPKQYPGSIDPTFLSRTFSDQVMKKNTENPPPYISPNVRKRKYETHTGSIDDSSKKEILSPPPYAVENEVHFGRWQFSNNTSNKRSIITSSNLTSPTLSQASTHSLTSIPEKHPYRLPPLNEIMRNSHKYSATDFYLPIDPTFFI